MTQALPILTTVAYRSSLARLAAEGGEVSPIAYLAFGEGGAEYSPDLDTGMSAEVLRLPCSCTANGPEATASATLPGSLVVGSRITEVGAFTAAGTLVARKRIAPVELEPYGEMDFDIVFEY